MEEAPSSLLTPEVRAKMGAVVVKAMKDIGYETAGTLEFLVDREGKFYALEVNTRIQVEHTVTEMISGFDIIRKMYKISAGERLSLRQEDVLLRGHAIQCRVNAEDPKNNFTPSFGRIAFLRQISGPFVRTESGIYQGWEVPPFYDSLLVEDLLGGEGPGDGDPADAARPAGIRPLGRPHDDPAPAADHGPTRISWRAGSTPGSSTRTSPG